jgi:hypothetical protein
MRRPIGTFILAVLSASAIQADGLKPADSLAALVKDLDAPKAEGRIAAADALRRMGTAARPATAALCKAVAVHSGKTRTACLDALKTVAPELHPHVETLAIEGNFQRHKGALDALAGKGADAAPALPVILLYHRLLPTMLAAVTDAGATGRSGATNREPYSPLSETYAGLENAALRALAAIAPTNVDTRAAFLAALKPVVVNVRGRTETFPKHGTEARLLGLEGLTRTGAAHLEYASRTVKDLRIHLADTSLTIEITRMLPRLGLASKEALPDLRKLRTSNTRELRDAAADAIDKIEAIK